MASPDPVDTGPVGAPRRRRLPLVLGGAALVLVLGGGAVLTASGAGPEPRPDTVAAGAGAGSPRPAGAMPVPTAATERALLQRRAAAVLTHDHAAWTADLDRHDDAFRAEQEQLWNNLLAVPLASWRYELVGRAYSQPQLAAHYGAPYALPAVLLHYALAGYDPHPVARPQVLTFVLRDGRWLLGGDSDADELLPETGHADPWDRRAVVVGRGRHVLVVADATDRARLGALVTLADTAVDRVVAMWPTGWTRRAVVVAVRDPHLLETYFRTEEQSSTDVSAIAVPAFDDVPGWSAASPAEPAPGRPASRIIVNPRYFDPTDPSNEDTLTHELTHVATLPVTRQGAPTWLVEGVAEYTAGRGTRLDPARDLAPSLRQQAAAGSVPLGTAGFYSTDVASHYEAADLACHLIVAKVGERGLRTLYARLGPVRRPYETLDAQDRAFASVLSETTEQFETELATYVRTRSR